MRKSIIIILSLVTLLSACSSEESAEHQLIGTWTGQLFQETYGNYPTTIVFSSLNIGQIAANVSYEENDGSDCDPAIFDCSTEACNATWRYEGLENNVYRFTELAQGSFCIDGDIKLQLVNDNSFTYVWEAIDEPGTVSIGTMLRQ